MFILSDLEWVDPAKNLTLPELKEEILEWYYSQGVERDTLTVTINSNDEDFYNLNEDTTLYPTYNLCSDFYESILKSGLLYEDTTDEYFVHSLIDEA